MGSGSEGTVYGSAAGLLPCLFRACGRSVRTQGQQVGDIVDIFENVLVNSGVVHVVDLMFNVRVDTMLTIQGAFAEHPPPKERTRARARTCRVRPGGSRRAASASGCGALDRGRGHGTSECTT